MQNGQKGGYHMIGKLKKGSSFGGCIRYVTGKDEAKILACNIADALKYDVRYMWICGGKQLSFATINRFRSNHMIKVHRLLF